MVKQKTNPRLIAFYLPQFHPIPENDIWWGKGFTEWTNVGKAKPLFKGHYQPRVPADLGYYDLRLPDTRNAQADLAREHGIEGFCYWHYWFGNGKRLLEHPFNEVLTSGKPDFPFCLAWANETWKGFDHGLTNRNILIEQLYHGIEDYTAHFYEVLPAFKDKRYITVEDKPLFVIYKPMAFSDISVFIDIWQRLAKENGLKGIYFVGHSTLVSEIQPILEKKVNAVNINRLFTYLCLNRSLKRKMIDKLNKIFRGMPMVYSYKSMMPFFAGKEDKDARVFPSIFPNWDHTPRSGREGVVFHNSTPELFEKHVIQIKELINLKKHETNIVFIKSWNEWAEGNYLEPDLKYGLKYLEIIKKHFG